MCVFVCVCMCVCVCVGFVMCGCFVNVCDGILPCFVLFLLYFCIVSFMYIYSYLFVRTGVRTTATE